MKTIYQSICLCLLLCTALFVSAQVPVYNSYPSGIGVIFLDFDGHVVVGTSWNGSGPIVCDPSNLTVAKITEVYNRVAEDYRPFDVNVTTDSAMYWAAPPTKRMRVVLTTSSSWFGVAGGVAYNYSFTWGDNTPCFVFTALHNYNAKNIAEAASHEVGHTLGLRHQSAYDVQCNKTAEYNAGTGSGEIGWAPIMGVGYYENMTLWHYGANPYGCTAYQDDLAIITGASNGIGYRPDDYSSTFAGAAPAAFNNNAFTVDGIIESPADVDAIKFTLANAGNFTLDAAPYSVAAGNTGADIDLEIQLFNSAQVLLGVYNQPVALNASIDTQLNAGTYYLRVQGKGNVYAPDYASLGSYSLRGTLSNGSPLPLRKLQLKGAVEAGKDQLTWAIIADEKVVRQTLEVAADHISFQPLTDLAATVRNYRYMPVTKGLLYYRLNVLFDNGRQYYSNTVALRNNGELSKPFLVGNLTHGRLTVNSPSAFSYTVYDAGGKAICKGSLHAGVNSINTAAMKTGLHIIEYNNGAERFTEKLLKQ